MIVSRLRTILQFIDFTMVVGLSLSLTGFLSFFYPAGLLQDILFQILGGEIGLALWKISMIVCGVGIIRSPQYLLRWLIPYYVFLLSPAIASIQGTTTTALLYYSLYLVMILTTTTRLSTHLKIRRRIIGVFQALMTLTLLIDPHGSGMSFYYSIIETLLRGFDPVTFTQLMYGLTAIPLIFFDKMGKYALQVYTLPFVIHGLVFSLVVCFISHAWSALPFLICPVFALWHIGSEGEDPPEKEKTKDGLL